jgi:peptidoglycan/LPS O-acetylase OafA/YrhL
MPLQSLQILRAIAALMVLISHLGQSEMRFLADPIMPAWLVAGVSGVDLFFVISGFVMVYVTRPLPTANAGAIGGFLFARVTRIYPIYWVFTGAMAAAYAFIPGLSRNVEDFDILANLLLLPSYQLPVLVVAWTLIHELYFYLAFAVLLLAPARWLPGLLLAWLAGVAIAHGAGLASLSPAMAIVVHPLTAEFILGCAIGLLVVSGRRKFALPALALGLVWWSSATAFLAFTDALSQIPMGWDRVLAWGVPAGLIVYGALGLELDHGVKGSKSLERIGDWSYALYLCHLPLVAFLARLWASHGPELGWFDNVLVMIIGAAASLIVAAMAFYIIERPTIRWARQAGKQLFRAGRSAGARTPADRIW